MRNKAFLSYSHADKAMAEALHPALEQFASPWYARRAFRIFRDNRGMAVSPEIWTQIQAALEASDFLLILASPASAGSDWVTREAGWWLEHRSIDSVLLVVVDGELVWSSKDGDSTHGDFDWARTTCLPALFTKRFAQEPLFADLRGVTPPTKRPLGDPTFRAVIPGIASRLHGRPPDELDGEDLRQHRRLKGATTLVALVVVALTLLLGSRHREAARRGRQALAREVAAAAAERLGVQSELGTLLAIEAVRATYSKDRVVTREAENILRRATSTALPVHRITAHQGPVWAVAYTKDGSRLATAGGDRTWRLWDVQTWAPLLAVSGDIPTGGKEGSPEPCPPETICGFKTIAFDPSGTRLLAAQTDGHVALWDASSGAEIRPLVGHRAPVIDVAFSRDGTRVATASQDGTAIVWDAESGKDLQLLIASIGGRIPVTSVDFGPVGDLLALAGADGDISTWNASSGRLVKEWASHSGAVQDLTFNPKGNVVASAGTDGTVRLWNPSSGEELARFGDRETEYVKVAFSPDGQRIAAAARSKKAYVWDVPSGQILHTLSGHSGGVWSVAFNQDGKRLATASYDATVAVWNLDDDPQSLPAHKSVVNGIAFSSDSKYLVTAGWDATARMWNVDSKQAVWSIAEANALYCAAFSRNGQYVATGGDTLSLWEMSSGKKWRTLGSNRPPVLGVAFSPDDKYVAAAYHDGTATVWAYRDEREMFSMRGHQGGLTSVSYSANGKWIATGGKDGVAVIWDASSGKSRHHLAGHDHPINGAAFSPNSRYLATASEDNKVVLWNAQTGEKVRTLGGQTSLLTGVAFSPDGSRIAASSLDGSVRVWETSSGEEAETLEHSTEVWGVAFSSDGRLIAAGLKDGTVRFHLLITDELLALARSRVQRKLTDDECRLYLHLQRCRDD